MGRIAIRVDLRGASLALVLALAIGVGCGCGKSNTQRAASYRTQVNQIGDNFFTTVQGLRNSPAPRSQAEALTRVGSFESALTNVETRFRKLRAPEPVAALQRRLIKTIGRFGAEVRRAVADTTKSDRRARQQSLGRFLVASQRTSSDVQTTIAQINAKLRGSHP